MAVDTREIVVAEGPGGEAPEPPRPTRRKLPPVPILVGVAAGFLGGGVGSLLAWIFFDASFWEGVLWGAVAATGTAVGAATATAVLLWYVRRGAPGVGLVKGLTVTLKHLLSPSITQEYPEERPLLPPRSRGVIALKEANCTVCWKCSRECPDWCIYIEAHKETHEPASGGRARSAKVLDRFAIDYALCMYCGICVEVCPFDALFWTPEFEYAEYDIREMIHERERLEEWTFTALPPPELELGAEPPEEAVVAAPGSEGQAAQVQAPPAPAAAPKPAPPSAEPREGAVAPAGPGARGERVEVEPDPEVFDRVLAEQLAQGKDRRVADGQALRAAKLAARKKAQGG
ncbi:MAG: NADH-quinone oxidoreductase subunit I [Actinobacteria bacterium]|nr:NADH-quinone oxidoreductase subunit I [Actinomycetota bacterium]